jgi:hypothetical protein
LFLIDADEFLATSGVLAKAIVGDSVKPGGKFCLAAKRPNIFVSANESVLGQIVRQCEVATRELSKQTANTRLMPADQLAESVLVVVGKNSGDKACIG